MVALPQVSLAMGVSKLQELPHSTVLAGAHTIVGGVVSTIVRVAMLLVTEPELLFTTTSYPPAFAKVGLLMSKVELLAPEIGVPLNRHWYESGPLPVALTLKLALPLEHSAV